MTTLLQQVRKRSGQHVPFEPEKIVVAVRKAFFAVTGDAHNEDVQAIAEYVVKELDTRVEAAEGEYAPGVEEIQDLVELAIMQRGFYDVAKAYIIYRFEHQKVRQLEQEEVKEKIARSELVVEKRSGEKELFDLGKVRRTIERASVGIEENIDVDGLIAQCQSEMYDGMTTQEIADSLILVARSFIERDPTYGQLASRILLQTIIYKEVIGYDAEKGSLEDQYRKAFVRNIQEEVSLGLLDERMLDFDLERLASAIEPSRDDLLRYLGTQTLYDRYFIRDKRSRDKHRLFETPQMMWMRVAMGLSLLEDKKNERALSFYEVYSHLRFISSTPTLFHAGTPKSQLSSCYLGVVDDTLESIFKAYADYASMAKYDGGIGYSWTKIRATGGFIKTTQIDSNGVVPFLKIADSTTVAINRSGRRRGAHCVYLETWHYDIEDFLELRKNTGDDRRRTHDMNTANWIPDLFMKRVRDDEVWSLFSPNETPELPDTYGKAFERKYMEYEQKGLRGELRIFRQVRARDLWKKMITQLFETGHPWINFKDPSNVRSPQDHVGVIHNSNLCTEITLNTAADEEVAVCNLGSVNLARHMKGEELDKELLKQTVRTAMRMLDNVIDLNFYPIPETRRSNMRHRPVGLGLMGFQDALFMQNIKFDSEACVRFADESMELISYYSILASSELAAERGAYETFAGSKWDRGLLPVDTIALLEEERGEQIQIDRTARLDWAPVRESIKQHGMRNSNCMAIAPTATISNISGCFPTIEPIYKNIYVKSNISGTFIVVNHYLIADLKHEGLWNGEMLELIKGQEGNLQNISSIPEWIKEKHKEVFIIDQQWLIRAAAHRAKWIDQSQSLNIFYSGVSGKDLSDLYQYAWATGLKTTYYLRSLGASGIEQSTVSLANQSVDMTRKGKENTAEAKEAVAKIREEAVVEVSSTPQAEERFEMSAPSTSAPKLCKLEDPDCESCQ